VLELDLAKWILKPETCLVNRGAITEAFVGQELLAYSNPARKASLYYWHREAHSSNAELDYLLQQRQNIIPIKVLKFYLEFQRAFVNYTVFRQRRKTRILHNWTSPDRLNNHWKRWPLHLHQFHPI